MKDSTIKKIIKRFLVGGKIVKEIRNNELTILIFVNYKCQVYLFLGSYPGQYGLEPIERTTLIQADINYDLLEKIGDLFGIEPDISDPIINKIQNEIIDLIKDYFELPDHKIIFDSYQMGLYFHEYIESIRPLKPEIKIIR